MSKASAPQKYRDSWRIKWFDEKHKRHSACYLSYAEAEKALVFKKNEVEQIKLGVSHRYKEEKTFSDLSDYWLKDVAPLKRSYKDQISIIEKHLRPLFGKIKLKDINQEHGQTYIVSKGELSKKTIANHLTVLISMLNFAKDMKWMREVPKIRKPKIPRRGSAFSYLRNDDELQRFLDAAKEVGENVYVLYLMAVLTGMRAGELAGLHWADVDFCNRSICVQYSFTEPTKSEEIRHIPILDSLLPILEKWREKKITDLVFNSTRGTMLGESARIYQETFKMVLDNANFNRAMKNGKNRHYIVFHDLRHTFASHWMMKGGDIYRLQKILGHSSIELTQCYAHLSPHIYKEDYSRFNTIKM